MKVKNITGIKKFFITQGIKVDVFFHYLFKLFSREMSFRHFKLVIKRLLVFIKTLKDNKFYKEGRDIKLGLYIPFYRTQAFYKACDKFRVFNEKLPCTIALVSVTKACRFKCKHCYQRWDKGSDLNIELLKKSVLALKEAGVAFFNIEGGDPFLVYDRLKVVCETIGFDGEIFINSTGDGITQERLRELNEICNLRSIMFSLHSPKRKEVNFFMGREYAWNTLIHGIRVCQSVGINTSINSCLQKDDYYNGNFEYVMEKAKEFKSTLVQLIHPKAAGAWLKGGFPGFTEDDINHIKKQVLRYNKNRKLREYPAISAQVIEEDRNHYGCTAGGTDRVYINAKGDVQPCEFLNISFGNVNIEDFKVIFKRMRDEFQKPGLTWLCEKCSGKIDSLRDSSQTLPLPPSRSREVINQWDRGEMTPMYKKIEEDLV